VRLVALSNQLLSGIVVENISKHFSKILFNFYFVYLTKQHDYFKTVYTQSKLKSLAVDNRKY
jgi:hypothetical protein